MKKNISIAIVILIVSIAGMINMINMGVALKRIDVLEKRLDSQETTISELCYQD
jgi:hypothetical protein